MNDSSSRTWVVLTVLTDYSKSEDLKLSVYGEWYCVSKKGHRKH